MTLIITAFSLMTLSLKGLCVTLIISDTQHKRTAIMLIVAFIYYYIDCCYAEWYYAECCYAGCRSALGFHQIRFNFHFHLGKIMMTWTNAMKLLAAVI
jgi:hypothetical protein